jgi:hypothetical protein
MRGSGQQSGDSRRQALGERYVTGRVRPAGMRVAEAESADDGAVVQNGNDQRGTWREPAVQLRAHAADRHPVIVNDAAAQRRLAGTDHGCDGAHQIVASNRRTRDQRPHLAGKMRRAVRGGDTAQRARRGEVNEAEVGKARKRFAHASIERASSCSDSRGL